MYSFLRFTISCNAVSPCVLFGLKISSNALRVPLRFTHYLLENCQLKFLQVEFEIIQTFKNNVLQNTMNVPWYVHHSGKYPNVATENKHFTAKHKEDYINISILRQVNSWTTVQQVG